MVHNVNNSTVTNVQKRSSSIADKMTEKFQEFQEIEVYEFKGLPHF